MDLLDFISIKNQKFYTNLKHSENEQTEEDIEEDIDDIITISDDEIEVNPK